MSGASVEIAIVGGGPAAQAGAAAYREAGGRGPVAMLCREPHLPYERPPLTKEYLRGEAGAAELPIEGQDWYEEHGVEAVTGAVVDAIDLEQGELRTLDGRSWSFERCLLASGARPAVPDLPGAASPRVRQIRTIEDADRLAEGAGAALVLGSGFIGCEAAASLALRGREVTLATLEEGPQEERLGRQVAWRIERWLRELGVELLFDAGLREIEEEGGCAVARFGDGRRLAADEIVMALGVTRNDELAEAAGLAVDDGVPTDASMRSGHPRLFAAGDVAFAENAAAARRLRVEHWGEALHMGEVAGRTLAGSEASWSAAPGFWSTIGSHTLKYAGWGDGWDEMRFSEGAGGSFVARYGRDGELAGVLAHEDDEAFERGRAEVEARAPWS